MRSICIALFTVIGVALGNGQFLEEQPVGSTGDTSNKVDTVDDSLDDTDLLMSFVVSRHGDRTPDEDELEKTPLEHYKDVFFPYGKKALTNVGKQRGFRVGEYLRKRYNNIISNLYLPDEVSMRTTDFARTKMTALTTLAAMYPPPPAQKWNPFLNWQPIPYDTLPPLDDDLLYYYNCKRYSDLRSHFYQSPEIQALLKPYEDLFKILNLKTGTNITNPEDVFFLDNLFQALENVGVKAPMWSQPLMAKIKEITKIEYIAQFFNSEMIRLASGVLLADILNATHAAILGDRDLPKLSMYSLHENNVGAIMSAIRVFWPHQPAYGSTVSLELRKKRSTGKYGFTAVYASTPEVQETILPIRGCGGHSFCDYDTFVSLIQENVLPRSEYKKACSTPLDK